MNKDNAIAFVNELIDSTKKERIYWSLKKVDHIFTGLEDYEGMECRCDETNSYAWEISPEQGTVYVQKYLFTDGFKSASKIQLSIKTSEWDARHLIDFEDVTFLSLIIRLHEIIKSKEERDIESFMESIINGQYPVG